MSLKRKINLQELEKKAEKAVITDVERALDRVRDKIFLQAKKAGGWRTYIDILQRGKQFVLPR